MGSSAWLSLQLPALTPPPSVLATSMAANTAQVCTCLPWQARFLTKGSDGQGRQGGSMLFSFQMTLQRHRDLLPKMPLPPASSIFLLCLRRQLAKFLILLRQGKPFVDDAFKCWNKVVLSHFILYGPCCKPSVVSKSQDIWQVLPIGEQAVSWFH